MFKEDVLVLSIHIDRHFLSKSLNMSAAHISIY